MLEEHKKNLQISSRRQVIYEFFEVVAQKNRQHIQLISLRELFITEVSRCALLLKVIICSFK